MAKDNKELLSKVNGHANGSAEKPKTVADQVADYLGRPDVKQQLAMALPKHVTPDRLARIALTNIRTTPALLECTMPSLIAAIMQSAQLGLEPGLLGHAYFVPFNTKVRTPGKADTWVKSVQFIIGYKGLIDLARRTGAIVTIDADVICSNDRFVFRKGFEPVLEWEPNYQDRGEPIAYFACATTKDGGKYATVMTLADVNKIRGRSKAGQSGPWVSDFDEMAKKTVLRRLCKYLPMSIELANTIAKDERLEFDDATALELNLGDEKRPAIELDPEPLAAGPVLEPEVVAVEAGTSDLRFEQDLEY